MAKGLSPSVPPASFFLVNGAYRPNPERGVHTFCHALPEAWHQMAVMLSAASCLRWLSKLTGVADEKALVADAESLDDEGRARAPLFLPYLSGERTPHNDPSAQGVWFGLQHHTDRAQLAYSVLEGVAFGLADGYAALRDASGIAQSIALIGGGSRSRYWARLIASVLDLPLTVPEASDISAAFGAARLAQLAIEQQANIAAVCKPSDVAATIDPVPSWRHRLSQRFDRFRELYPALRSSFERT
jgi:xylulokinase